MFACASPSDAGEQGGDEAPLDAACEPSETPTLELGAGESAYASFEPGATLELVHGPQGGVHTFMALEARGIAADVELEGTLRGYLGEQQVGASYPFLNFRCRAGSGWQVWGLLLIWDAAPEDLHLQPVRIDVEVTDAAGVVVTASKEAVLHDPLQG
jgi:hypothetical protein